VARFGQVGLGFHTAAGFVLARVQAAEGRRLAGIAEVLRIGIESEQDRNGAYRLQCLPSQHQGAQDLRHTC